MKGFSPSSYLRRLRRLSQGDPRIRVAILDGPVDLEHPAFRGAHIEVAETDSQERRGESVHGTHIASLLFGQPGGPLEGIAPLCRGLIVPVFPQDSVSGLLPCSQERLALGIQQALDWGAHVINVSGGELVEEGNLSFDLLQAVERCSSANVLIVAAAGNDGCDCAHLPAALAPVLAVGATDEHGRPLASSNWGAALHRQGVVAPGRLVLGAVPGGGVAAMSGTSFATPVVSGTAALLLSLQIQQGLRPDPSAVRAAILKGANPCKPERAPKCRRFLAGSLNPFRAAQNLFKQGDHVMNDIDSILSPIPEGSPAESLVLPAEDLVRPPTVRAAGISPNCGCMDASYLVYAVGNLGYDFGTEARLNSFRRLMTSPENPHPDPLHPEQLAHYLEHHPEAATQLHWLLLIDREPVYTLLPAGAYAHRIHEHFRKVLRQQNADGTDRIERIVVPGVAGSKARLLSGVEVPVLQPDFRGFAEWNLEAETRHILALGSHPTKGDEGHDQPGADDVRELLKRLAHEVRNRGASPQDRARNYAATSGKWLLHNFSKPGYVLDTLTAEPARFCRPGADCWTVEFRFFKPEESVRQPRHLVRLVVDVSDTIPSLITEVEGWAVYS